jgi:exopolysaccharide biosynthesis WecB/TagA/CpsF family protein
LEKAAKLHLKLFLFGSTKETLDKFSDFIHQNYSGVEICGIHPDRFREATKEEDLIDIEVINNSGAHLIFVGRGCPRQEYWVENHKNKIHGAMMAIGAAFDFHAQNEKRAPKWMRDNSLEWLFRLLNNPKRLWKRYFITNSIFIYLFIKHKLKN